MYLAIYNDGVIDPNSFRVAGLTSKRGDSSKIGFFGTGLKYALAVLAREKIGIRIVSQGKRYTFGTKPLLFRGQDADEITVGGKRLGFTSDLGPQWKLWMALREIFCNALDEGGFRIEYINRLPKDFEGTATIINLTDEIRQVMQERKSWLILDDDDVEVIFEDDLGNRILERRGKHCSVFKKNVRVWHNESDDCPYDFVMPNVSIDEKREASTFDCALRVASLLKEAPKEVRQRTLRHCLNAGILQEALKYYTNFGSESWQEAISDDDMVDVVCSQSQSRRFAEELSATNKLVLPDYIHAKIQDGVPKMKEKSVKKVLGDQSFKVADISDNEKDALEGTLEILRAVKFSPMEHEIKVGTFVDPLTLGQASDDTILISREILAGNRWRTLFETLIEEELHILSGQGDKTRSFQDVLVGTIVDFISSISGKTIANVG